MPELLLTAGPGSLYPLWLVAINSKGPSAAGPVQSWTAVCKIQLKMALETRKPETPRQMPTGYLKEGLTNYKVLLK